MAFSLKENWPILAIGLVAILGLVLLLGGSGGGGGTSSAAPGLSSAEASLLSQSNEGAVTLSSAQIAAQQQLAQTAENGVIGTVQEVLSNQSALSNNTLQAQVAEYQAYEQELLGVNTNVTGLQATQTVSGNQLQAILAQISAAQQQAQLQAILAGLNTAGGVATVGIA